MADKKPPFQDDALGEALLAHWATGRTQKIEVRSPDLEDEVYRSDVFFTPEDELPPLEQKALALAKGRVLDIGAAAGRHSVILAKQTNCEVHAIDISPGCVELLKKRGIHRATCVDIMNATGEYDTLLLLMNGIGLAGKLRNMQSLLAKLRTLLAPGGQILFDSGDIQHIYQDSDALLLLSEVKDYYGEVLFQFKYQKLFGPMFSWVYVDAQTMMEEAAKAGFSMEIVQQRGRYGQYLARLTLQKD